MLWAERCLLDLLEFSGPFPAAQPLTPALGRRKSLRRMADGGDWIDIGIGIGAPLLSKNFNHQLSASFAEVFKIPQKSLKRGEINGFLSSFANNGRPSGTAPRCCWAHFELQLEIPSFLYDFLMVYFAFAFASILFLIRN